ncbi:DUF5301 domain-containing protein [Candidatus Allofournierella excrementavium]|uniref:DUF5301 domain-containing protein n=1 Tax=Candidatus Allofournierella excrementavium TaxID=2838591 RepID=UPI003AF43A68
MKRTLWTILLAAMLLFSACALKAGPLTLPDADDVTEVRLEYGGESVVRAGPGWIGMLLEDLAAAQPTRKATVQDVPDKEDMAAVHFVLEDGSEQTLFVYPEKDKWYIERPYEGVYETDQLLWVMVTDLSE